MSWQNGIALPVLAITCRDEELDRAITERSVALGTGLADEFKTQMKLLVRDVVSITPPGTGSNTGSQKALQQGQSAISRDLFLMGFVPVTIKGHRIISHVPAGNIKGRPAVPISAVSVPTTINPKFDDPDAFHASRIQRKSDIGRRRASRGGAQAFYVAASKYKAMKTRSFKEIGTLAAPWLPGIRALFDGELPAWVPAWIRRHEADQQGRSHYAMSFDQKEGKMFIRIINSMPDSAAQEAEDTQRRIEAAKLYRINAIRRGLEGRAKRIAQSFRR